MATQSKKIANGLYQHKSTGKFISAFYGEIETIWNIWNDVNCINEFAVGFATKSEAIEYLNTEEMTPIEGQVTIIKQWNGTYIANFKRDGYVSYTLEFLNDELQWHLNNFKKEGVHIILINN